MCQVLEEMDDIQNDNNVVKNIIHSLNISANDLIVKMINSNNSNFSTTLNLIKKLNIPLELNYNLLLQESIKNGYFLMIKNMFSNNEVKKSISNSNELNFNYAIETKNFDILYELLNIDEVLNNYVKNHLPEIDTIKISKIELIAQSLIDIVNKMSNDNYSANFLDSAARSNINLALKLIENPAFKETAHLDVSLFNYLIKHDSSEHNDFLNILLDLGYKDDLFNFMIIKAVENNRIDITEKLLFTDGDNHSINEKTFLKLIDSAISNENLDMLKLLVQNPPFMKFVDQEIMSFLRKTYKKDEFFAELVKHEWIYNVIEKNKNVSPTLYKKFLQIKEEFNKKSAHSSRPKKF